MIRFITVSKEVTWLNNKSQSYHRRGYCPQGILWLKKFSKKSKDYSVTTIDKEGKGGIISLKLTRVGIAKNYVAEFPLSKKQLTGKFKESVVVVLHSNHEGKKRSVVIRCISMEAAKFLCTGCVAIIEVLKLDAPAKEQATKKVAVAQHTVVAAELGLRNRHGHLYTPKSEHTRDTQEQATRLTVHDKSLKLPRTGQVLVSRLTAKQSRQDRAQKILHGL